MNQVDLHTHSTASDGALAPGQLVRRAGKLGLKVLAITDHDTVAGIPEALAAGASCGVEIIPGVEINTDVPGAEVHVLGYFVDHEHAELNEKLALIRDGRIGRARRMAESVDRPGRAGPFERILEIRRRGLRGPAACGPGAARGGPRYELCAGIRELHRPEQPCLCRADEVHPGRGMRT